MKGPVDSIIIGLREHKIKKLFTAKLNLDAAEAMSATSRSSFSHFLLTAWHFWKESSTVAIFSIVAKIVSSIATNTIETISDNLLQVQSHLSPLKKVKKIYSVLGSEP